jgi:hypothetical protein
MMPDIDREFADGHAAYEAVTEAPVRDPGEESGVNIFRQ